MSDTPRTDAALLGLAASHPYLVGAYAKCAQVERERNKLRQALVQLVGADGGELVRMEAVMKLMPAESAEDKDAMISAVHALREIAA